MFENIATRMKNTQPSTFEHLDDEWVHIGLTDFIFQSIRIFPPHAQFDKGQGVM